MSLAGQSTTAIPAGPASTTVDGTASASVSANTTVDGATPASVPAVPARDATSGPAEAPGVIGSPGDASAGEVARIPAGASSAPDSPDGVREEADLASTHGEKRGSLPQFKDIELVSDGWVKKYLLTYVMPDGSEYRYESVSRKGPEEYRAQLLGNASGHAPAPDAVCIVPILPDDSLLLIREFRYPVNAQVIAFPAGLIEPGESLADCVDRELREETGYRLRRSFDRDPLMPLPQPGYSSVGMAEESVRVVIAYVEPDGDARPGDAELIETFTLARDEIGPFLDANREPIGTRCQLLLEAARRTNVLRKRLALLQNPLRSEDFA